MEKLETYKGWRNKETCVTQMWMANNYLTYTKAVAVAEGEGLAHQKANKLALIARDELGEQAKGNGWLYDMLSASLERVDWSEVLASFNETDD